MTVIQLSVDENLLLLIYSPEDPRWVTGRLESGESVPVRRTFHFETSDLLPIATDEDSNSSDDDVDKFVFALGELSGEYFKIKPHVVRTKNTFHFHKSMPFSTRMFVAERNISVLRKIDELVAEDVYVGGTGDDAMPESAYAELVDRFPNSYEMRRYASARVGACVRDYFDTASDTELLYQKYMNRRVVNPGSGVLDVFRFNEIAKYKTLLGKLEAMLTSESSYSERQWQDEILDIIRLLYPKYIRAFAGTPIWDSIGNKNRFLDLLLIDSCGNVDLIEIKRPFDNCIVSKRQYRDNYIPLKELTGAVMQLEKYILYLNKWGQRGENQLSERYEAELPVGLRLKITNPKGIIIMGREDKLSAEQRGDFEVIKRKYSNVIDIVTYDDLLSRLRFTIAQLQLDEATA